MGDIIKYGDPTIFEYIKEQQLQIAKEKEELDNKLNNFSPIIKDLLNILDKNYGAPFYLWPNYNIKEKTNVKIGLGFQEILNKYEFNKKYEDIIND